MTVVVMVDDREGKRVGKIEKMLEAKEKVMVTEGRMEVGDIFITNGVDAVVVEYKRAVDFLDSIKDKRIFMQVRTYRDIDERVIIFVDGWQEIWKWMRIKKMNYYRVMGVLLWIAKQGIPVVFAWRDGDFKYFLLKIIDDMEKEERDMWDWREMVKKRELAKEEKMERQAYSVLMSFAGVGGKTAKRMLAGKTLAEFFRELMEKDEEELSKVERNIKQVWTYRIGGSDE